MDPISLDFAASKGDKGLNRSHPDQIGDRRVVVRPDDVHGWLVEWSEGQFIVARKTEAVKLAREITKNIAGRSTMVVLKLDGSEASTTGYGSDRPPMKSYLQA